MILALVLNLKLSSTWNVFLPGHQISSPAQKQLQDVNMSCLHRFWYLDIKSEFYLTTDSTF